MASQDVKIDPLDELGPPLRLIRQHSKEHEDQIKLIRQSSKDWVEKHSKCALTDIVVDSHTGYILTRDPTCAYHIPALQQHISAALKDVPDTILVKSQFSVVSPADLSLLLNEHTTYTYFARLFRKHLNAIDTLQVKVGDKTYKTNPDHSKIVAELESLAAAVKEKKEVVHDSDWFVTKSLKAIRHALKWTCPDDFNAKLNLFGGARFQSESEYDARARFLQLHWVLLALDQHFTVVTGRKVSVVPAEELDKLEQEDKKSAESGTSSSAAKELTEEEKKELQKKKKVNAGGVGYAGSAEETSYSAALAAKEKELLANDELTAAYLELVNSVLVDSVELTELPLVMFARLYLSSLCPFLAHFLVQDALTEIARRAVVYRSVLKLVRTLGSNPHTLPLLRADDSDMEERLGDHRPLMKMLLRVKKQAGVFLETSASAKGNLDHDELTMLSIAGDIQDLAGLLETQATIYRTTKRKIVAFHSTPDAGAAGAAGATPAGDVKIDAADSKVDEKGLSAFLLGAQFAMMDIMNGPLAHHYRSEILGSPGVKAKGKLRKEIASMTSGLPPGIFVRVDQERFDCLRVAIVGPYDTPYENGVFMFDIMLPPEYPDSPPKVCFETTGKGTFRFNANLYNNGKVCLSLLGTWSGPGWDPKVSSLLQVFLSIQAMIFCDEPYYNEPGWANDKGTDREKNAHIYHAQIRHATMLYAMIDHIKTPPYGFEDVVKCFFYLNKAKLLKQADDWEKAHAGLDVTQDIYNWSGTTKLTTPIADAVRDLKELLTNMAAPNLNKDD